MRSAQVVVTLVLVLVLVCALALVFGTERTSFARALFEPDSLDRLILLRARIPRVALAAAAGAGLSVVGAALQALLRNPLADPYLLGVSGGAALGATVAILAGLAGGVILGAALVPLAALAGGLAATLLVYALARSTGSISGTEILLSGIIVNAMASALVTFAKTLATAGRAQELLFWLVGFIDVPTPAALLAVSVYVALGSAVLWMDAGRLNLLALGEEPAAHLGVDVRSLVRRVFFASSLVVGAVVSVTGLIGFVGLIVPHATRRIVGSDMRLVIPVCLLGGATVLVASDLAARASFAWFGSEPPVGAVTAILGGPLALALLRRSTRLVT
jgi:iron complex transport system permease protein